MKLEVFLFILTETIIRKCDTTEQDCGKLEVIEPAVLGRSVTLRFTPKYYATHGQVTWFIEVDGSSPKELTGSRYMTSKSQKSYRMMIVNTTYNDRRTYISYYATFSCYSNRIDLHHLRTERDCGNLVVINPAIRGRNVTLKFTPRNYVTNGQVTWKTISSQQLTNSRYITSQSGNSFFMMIINSTNDDRLTYFSYYENDNCYSNSINLGKLLKVPPTDVELIVSDAPSEAQAHYQINASCTVHKANPVCNITWSVTGGTETRVSFSKPSGESVQGFTITSDVTLNVPGTATRANVVCSATCTQFNDVIKSHQILLPGHKEDTEKTSGETSSVIGPVVGAVAGLLLVIIAVVVIIVILRRKKETKIEQEQRPLNNQSMPQQANVITAPPIDEQDAMYAQIDKSTKTKHSPVEENKDSNLVYVELDVDHLAATASGGTKATYADDEPTEYSGIDFVKTAHASNEEAVYANE